MFVSKESVWVKWTGCAALVSAYAYARLLRYPVDDASLCTIESNLNRVKKEEICVTHQPRHKGAAVRVDRVMMASVRVGTGAGMSREEREAGACRLSPTPPAYSTDCTACARPCLLACLGRRQGELREVERDRQQSARRDGRD